MHTKNKQIYSRPYELIISLERGINYTNKTMINFPFDLDLSKFVELEAAPNKFQLVGCVNYLEIKGEDHYISFTKNKNNDIWLCSDDDKINQADKSMALTYGIPVLLFYSFVRQNQH